MRIFHHDSPRASFKRKVKWVYLPTLCQDNTIEDSHFYHDRLDSRGNTSVLSEKAFPLFRKV